MIPNSLARLSRSSRIRAETCTRRVRYVLPRVQCIARVTHDLSVGDELGSYNELAKIGDMLVRR
jgi:hypothetical protein